MAPELLCKNLVISRAGISESYKITEVEAYHGEEDQASHARFGKTTRNSIMYGEGGFLYIYLIYGIYWMLNIVTGPAGQSASHPCEGLEKLIRDPGFLPADWESISLTMVKILLLPNESGLRTVMKNRVVLQKPRVGINYAGEPWVSHAWRFISA